MKAKVMLRVRRQTASLVQHHLSHSLHRSLGAATQSEADIVHMYAQRNEAASPRAPRSRSLLH